MLSMKQQRVYNRFGSLMVELWAEHQDLSFGQIRELVLEFLSSEEIKDTFHHFREVRIPFPSEEENDE